MKDEGRRKMSDGFTELRIGGGTDAKRRRLAELSFR